MIKTCRTCRLEKLATEFYQSKGRIRSACKACTRAYWDGRRALKRAYDVAYYHANKERRKAAALAWRAENRDRWADYSRIYRASNPEQFATYYRARYGRRVTGALPFTTAQLDARMSMFGRKCWMCGGPFEHVDHVKPLAKGGRHMLANLRPACGPCNGKKRDRWTGARGISTMRRTPCQ